MRIGLALAELHRAENDLALELLRVSERHRVDHETYHVARDVAAWSHRHVREVAEIGRRYGQDLDPEPEHESSLGRGLRDRASTLLGREGPAELLMLRDLRGVFTRASGVSVDWEMLAQAAQGAKHAELLALASRCHADTLRQVRWANARIKESSTQILVS